MPATTTERGAVIEWFKNSFSREAAATTKTSRLEDGRLSYRFSVTNTSDFDFSKFAFKVRVLDKETGMDIGSADINAGTSIVVIGLACLIIGETVIQGRKSIGRNILACLVGNVIYRLIYAIVLQTRIIPIECLKLMTAVIVALAIAAPSLKQSLSDYNRERREA